MYVLDYSNDVDSSISGPVTEIMEIELEGYASKMGDMISFNPVFFERQVSNPFKLENRDYPVDFSTPRKEKLMYLITLPEGYVVEQLPTPIRVTTETGSMGFHYNIVSQANMIQMMVVFDINKVKFIQSEYEELKQMMDIIVKKEKEQVILKKI